MGEQRAAADNMSRGVTSPPAIARPSLAIYACVRNNKKIAEFVRVDEVAEAQEQRADAPKRHGRRVKVKHRSPILEFWKVVRYPLLAVVTCGVVIAAIQYVASD